MHNLKKIFESAEKEGGLEYIFTLLRVEGITCHLDPIIQLKASIDALDSTSLNNKDDYKVLAESREPFSLIFNLVNCATKKPYRFMPFLHLRKGKFPNFQEPRIPELLQETTHFLNSSGFSDLGAEIEKSYSSIDPSNPETMREITSFLSELCTIYFQERLKFSERPKLYKLPKFEVLELVSDVEFGLCGFSMYFSNGCYATFKRQHNRTEALNIMLDESVGFQVGCWDEMTKRWRVKDKYLYEIGLSGRYNKRGEWKPIEYQGKSEEIEKEIRNITGDPIVSGCLFYIMTTCYRVIEFVIRTNIKMPLDEFSFGDKFHLFKCPNIGKESDAERNYYIYDGWLELDSIDPDYIKNAVASIGVAVNRMAFAYNGKVKWRLKYHDKPIGEACAVPTEEDLHILDSMFRKFPISEDAIFLDAAIEWFNRGRSTQNNQVSFLCYYFSFDLLAIAIAEGDAKFNFEKQAVDKKDIEKEKIKCIEEKLNTLYKTNPLEFVQSAYHDCVKSLRKKTQEVAELVFGKEHEYIKMLFMKNDGYSLNSLRGAIAHGVSGLLNPEIEGIIEKRRYELAAIVKSFLTRIIFGLKPNENLPRWSGQHFASMQTNDPRGTHVVSDLRVIPNTDWRIRPEWIEEI